MQVYCGSLEMNKQLTEKVIDDNYRKTNIKNNDVKNEIVLDVRVTNIRKL